MATNSLLENKMSAPTLKLLCSKQKLERDRGLVQLNKFLNESDAETCKLFKIELLKVLNDNCLDWESKHGSLLGAKVLLLHMQKNPDNLSQDDLKEFGEILKNRALALLTDEEARVRLASGEVLGALCQVLGLEMYISIKDAVLDLVQSNLDRHIHSDDDIAEQKHKDVLVQKLVGPGEETSKSVDSSQIFHDTAGWKSLETSMKCLQACIEGCGHRFNPCIDQPLLDLIFQALRHTNRFVRETGYQVCAALVSVGVGEDGLTLQEDNAVYKHGDQFAAYLGDGLADNWSQVRLAASVATRKFMLSLPSESSQEKFFPILLPRMCLNRYYVADGVRIYSQETWRQVTRAEGKEMVEKYIDSVQQYYIEQTKADNHAVREAACACVAELGSKVNQDAVRPYVLPLLEALRVCFNDDSWPVRDAACVACGNFIFCFPEECKSMMEHLYPLFFANLSDSIPSVRQGAAAALANIVRTYGQEPIEISMQKITQGLKGVESQKPSTDKFPSLEKGGAVFGVAKHLRDNDYELHTNQTMYSCGSLAPKMRAGGCMDHQFQRPPEPWEIGDGCIYLLAELSNIPACTKKVYDTLPVLADAARHRHYHHHVVFLESLAKQLPVIAKANKKMFKAYLELFFDPIFYALSCDNALASSAASTCLNELGKLLGPNILRARVEAYEPKYLSQLDANSFIASY